MNAPPMTIVSKKSINIQGEDYGSCALPFISLPSIYKPSFIEMPTVVLRLFTGQGA